MTNNDTNPAIATGLLEVAPGPEASHDKGTKKTKGTKRNKGRRRMAKALAYLALAFTGLLILAEPWLLVPVAVLALAISLWD
ncbi:hypothetical protein [Streptomyces sp. NBC_01216]|uniref:hypothetical protein n=1 Tax=unclassified Streptomyces TaxID=2593676 RepID=UPI002E14F92F|nr:hypothetical protein OG393_00575 [Streptomyces sp. NBC_01216]